LQELSASAAGMVCVNSTSGTLALENGIPVVVLGDAVYDVPGITHQSGLDGFWSEPERPDAELYAAFKKSLHAKCLVRGGLASASATETLVRNSVERLLAEDSMPIVQPDRREMAFEELDRARRKLARR
jgi:capsular polysaccharide export protein